MAKQALDEAVLDRICAEIQRMWAPVRIDHEGRELSGCGPSHSRRFLCYETDSFIFQLLVDHSAACQSPPVVVSLRFAYCNPRGIYEPFCDVTERLMQRYQLDCHPMRDLEPPVEGKFRLVMEAIRDPSRIRSILVPSMDYNRLLWQSDVGTTEEAALRPEDAIMRFVAPRFVKLT